MPGLRSRDPFTPFRTEILDEALAICRKQPFGDLRRPRIAYLHGVIASSQGRYDLAVAYLAHALTLDRATPPLLHDLGDAMLRCGRRPESLGAHLRAVVLAPGNPESYARLGRSLHLQGLHREALMTFEIAASLAPDDLELLLDIGDAHLALGQIESAVGQYSKALAVSPQEPELHRALATARLRQRRWTDALTAFEAGLAAGKETVDLHIGRGEALLRLGELDKAAGAFLAALVLNPRDINANRQYALTLEMLGRPLDAVGAWLNLGVALEAHSRFREAITAYGQAIIRKSDALRARLGLARSHISLQEPAQAVRRLKEALSIDPEHAEVHIGLGLAMQQTGEYEQSWAELAWHHLPTNESWRHVEQPVWDGADLHGKTVLLWFHKDESDNHFLQFLRYAQFAKERGARVMIECDKTLVPLARHAEGVDHVVATGGPLRPYDVHAPLMYLPALTPPARGYFGRSQYLRPPDRLVHRWRERLERERKPMIGLAWAPASADRDRWSRPISLRTLGPLAAIGDVRFVSLQLGPYGHELLAPPEGLILEEVLADTCTDLELAAVVLSLDLVITPANTLAHLAGALGVEVWTLLGFDAGWPWPTTGDRTPWYPAMRLFRQRQPGDWRDPIAEVASELTLKFGLHSMTTGR